MHHRPIDITLTAEGGSSSRRLTRLTWAFIFLGLAIRVSRYLLRFPLWPDEGFLAANFLPGSGYADLLGSLAYHQVAPLFFLWIELFAVKLLGFTEYSLRLFPFLCGLGSILLFYHLAKRLLKGAPLLLAVAVFTVSYYPIRHGAEIKPYSTDLFVSLVLLTLAVEWWRRSDKTHWLWWLAAAAPFAIGLSFTAVFVAGGVSLGLLPLVLRRRNRKTVIPYLAFNLVLLASFLAVYAVSTGPQYETEAWLSGPHPETEDFNVSEAWVKTFPPLEHPGKFAIWLVKTHTGRLFAYPNGGKHFGCTATFICFVVGAVVFFRRRRRTILAVFLAPFLLTFIAAALHRYPYGYSARFNLYLAPIICILAAAGMTRLLALIRPPKVRSGAFLVCLAGLALIGFGMIASDLIRPYKNLEDKNSRDFARRFWPETAKDGEVVCVYRDLGKVFFPRLFDWGHSSRYLCNQAIYSPDHRAGRHTPRRELIGPAHPLRCVVFSVPDRFEPYAGRDEEGWREWLEDMGMSLELIGQEKYEINPGEASQHETYEVYEFVPKPPTPVPSFSH